MKNREILKIRIARIDGSDTLWAYVDSYLKDEINQVQFYEQIKGYFHGDKKLADVIAQEVAYFIDEMVTIMLLYQGIKNF